jgi:fermentation-respiration switch protein FrsA (DUF1100 family)
MPWIARMKGIVLRNYWPTLVRIRNVRCPVLFIAGARDEIVPHSHMLRLFDAVQDGKRDIVFGN